MLWCGHMSRQTHRRNNYKIDTLYQQAIAGVIKVTNSTTLEIIIEEKGLRLQRGHLGNKPT